MVTISARFNGPPGSANGGYAAGVFAALLPGGAEVTLRSPPPLDTPLTVARTEGHVEVREGETLVAQAEQIDFELDVPEPVSVEEAREASEGYSGFREHAYSTCFVCGPDRRDGLGIHPGPVRGRELVAAPWTPPADVPDELVWAALDCPSGWAIDTFGRAGVLLGRLAVRILEPPRGGEPHVVLGWAVGADGRKRLAGSALLTAEGRTVAFARSIWLVPRAP
ncbi:MAG: hypothetical protein H0U90_11220 [Actinobacteria bacterium]|nr:hypothetical protein [Actinomycetota bacterium]